MIIKVSNEADRIVIAGILFKNGYTVRQVRIKQGNKSVVCIETTEKED